MNAMMISKFLWASRMRGTFTGASHRAGRISQRFKLRKALREDSRQ